MWRAAAVVLVLAAGVSGIEASLVAADQRVWAFLGGVFPLLGAPVAWHLGPRLRPRTSYVVGRLFLALGIATVAESVHTWRDSPVGGAMAFHYVIVIVFAAVFFNRREVVESLVAIALLHAAVLFGDGWSPIRALMWTLTLLGVAASGLVIERVVGAMHDLSYRDPLTGAHNRRSWDLALANALDEHGRSGGPLSVLLIDIDHFKAINDTDGHEAGDAVLRSAVATWRPMVRASDVLARLGGDEFAVCLPGCDRIAAVRVAELLVRAFSEATGASCSVGGVTALPPVTGAMVMAEADAQLYQVKRTRRGEVRTAQLGGSTVAPADGVVTR
jgi:diguanylate cyclase (GGDEF)-like protein